MDTLLKPYFIKNKDYTNIKNQNIIPKVSYFNAKEVATIYGFTQPQPNIVNVIGIISFGGGLFGTLDANSILTNGDVQAYWKYIGISSNSYPIVKIVLVDNATNSPNDIYSTSENTLDVEMVGACCTSASTIIILYIAPNSSTGFINVINTALNTPIDVKGTLVKPTTISISWGAPEVYYSDLVLNKLNNLFKAATESGINILVASGDNGSSDGIPNTKTVDFPAASPYVISCGGTKLVCPNRTYDNDTNESTWVGSGGGISSYFSMPLYQTNLNLNTNYRAVPDIAGVADPNTGIQFIINGNFVIFGGTSVVAPAYAGFIASLNLNYFILPRIYTYDSTSFHDILNGTNGDYNAGIGYDFTTGLGSLNGNIIGFLLNSNISSVSVTSITLSITLNINQTLKLSSIISPSNATNKNITWTSSNTEVASISVSGLITANANGNTTIIVTTEDQNKTISIQLIVVTPFISVTSITLNKTTLTLNPNQTFQLIPTISPTNASNKNITWTSSNINVATVSNTGLITAKTNGTINIIATIEDQNKEIDDQDKKARVILTVITPVTGITLNKTTLTLNLNQTFKLIPTIIPATASNKSIIWSSSKISICNVTNDGTVKRIAKGSAIITAKTVDGNKIATLTII